MGNKDKDGFQHSDLERVSELSKIIMAKCGGLPKVIDAVAANYNSVSFDMQAYSNLKDINDNFMHILEGLHSLRGLFSWMQHYLETCKDYLKPCIFYLPVFPIGHNIRTRRLIMRWLAEGHISDTSGRTLQENTLRLISEIWQFSMFQRQPSSKPVQYQVNGFLHEYINSRPMEDNFGFALDGSCRMPSQRAGAQHLTIRDNWKRDINVFRSTDLSRLRSFTVFGDCRPWMFDPKEKKMGYVRVLHLEDAKSVTNNDLKRIVEVFPRLKFLSLRGCRDITRLPKSLGRLRQLQSLDIRHTRVATLPEAILKLENLLYVRAGNIHRARWDESGTMVPYQTATPGEIVSTSVKVEDGTTFAAAPSASAEVATSPSAAGSEDIAITGGAPLSPAEIGATVAGDDKTFATSLLAPDEDARTATTASSALEEDPKIVAADLITTVPVPPSALVEVPTVVADLTALAEDGKIVAPTISTRAEDTTSLPAHPAVVAAPLAPTEDGDGAAFTADSSTHAEYAAATVAAAEQEPAKVGTTFVAAPSRPAEDATATVTAAPSAPSEVAATPWAVGSEDIATTGTAPLSPAEIGATVAGAVLAQTEDGKTVPTSLLSPDEDARTDTTASSALITTVPVAPSAPVEDTTVATDLTALAEDATIVAPVPSTRPEDTTSLAAHPTAAVEDTTIVAPVPSTLAEGGTIFALGRPVLSEDVTPVAEAPIMAASEDTSTPAAERRSTPHALMPSWMSKVGCWIQSSVDNTDNDGVEVPAGIGKLTSLHTFGVVNVGPGKNSVILKELPKLTLLWRISVCGINPDNIHQFFVAIKGLDHLGQLTVRLDKNKDGLIPSLDKNVASPPKTLDECLKLLGHVRILRGSWIKEFADVVGLDLDVTLQEQDDMQVILDHLTHRTKGFMRRLCIKPIQDGELRIGIDDKSKIVRLGLGVLEIVCTTNLHATIGNIGPVNVLRVECSTGSSLQLSGLQRIRSLKEVWLKGSCSDTLKQDLQRQLDQRQDKDKAVLKIFQQRSS